MVSEISNGNGEDILKIIPDEKLIQLRDLYKIDWPSHVHIYNFIDTAIKMKKKDKKFKKYITIYSPNGDWSDGTIVGIVQMRCYDVVLYSIDKTLKRLIEALKETNLIEWNRQLIFPTVKIEYKEALKDVKKQISSPFLMEGPSYIWWLPKEKALQYEWSIPSEYYLAPLKISDADTLNSEWPHRHPGSEKYIATLIEANGGIGIFLKDTNELCSWVLKSYLGALGILQVAPHFKRKGLGSLTAKIFSKMLAEEGLDSIGCVVLDNYISQHMFEKLGFEKKIAVTWLVDIECV